MAYLQNEVNNMQSIDDKFKANEVDIKSRLKIPPY
jgi:hypothetical protein